MGWPVRCDRDHDSSRSARAADPPDEGTVSPSSSPRRTFHALPGRLRHGVGGLLCIALTLLLADPAGAMWPFERPRRDLDPSHVRESAARMLSRAIRFDTTNPPGDERPLAEYLVRQAKASGLEARVVPTPGGTPGVGRAAVWARFRGTGHRRPIVLLSHLDVVPAARDAWAIDPFEGLVGGGHVVGRGALDAKGIAVVHLLALAELAARGTPLDRDVILLSVPDEETGGRQGSGYLVREHQNLLHDAEFLITEGGGILPGVGASPDIWGVTFTEKSPCWIELTAHGRPGHGSAAAGDEAVPRLIAALDRLRRYETPVRVTPEVGEMFRALSPYASGEDRLGLADLERALRLWPDFRERFLQEPGRNALVRTTVAITVLRAGDRTNVVPGEARAQVDARLLPGESCGSFVEQVRRVIDDPEVRVETILEFGALASPIDTDLFHAIERVAAAQDAPGVVVPRVISGFTDAHYYREVGIVAYGFVPRWLRARDTRGIHGPNERISLDNLEEGARLLVQILDELSAGPHGSDADDSGS
jgi:acetylornithine deacetylase/succinyl-diaminopimelate desuccinylase-like protein